jgi:hypothetical protein
MGDRENFRFCLPQMGGEDSRKFGDQIDGPRKAYSVGDGEACGCQLSSTWGDKWIIEAQ